MFNLLITAYRKRSKVVLYLGYPKLIALKLAMAKKTVPEFLLTHSYSCVKSELLKGFEIEKFATQGRV